MTSARAALISLFLSACVTEPATEPGSTEPFERVGTYLTGAHPVCGVILDIDGDGDDDVLAPALLTPDIVALQSEGGELGWRQVGPLATGAGGAIAADLDGDGRAELVTSNREVGRVDIYRVAGGDIALLATLEIAGATGMAAADFDGDSQIDLAVSDFNGDAIEVWLGSPAGLVRGPRVATSEGPFALVAHDIDADGRADLVSAAATADQIDVYSMASGSLTLKASVAAGEWPAALAVAAVGEGGAAQIVGTATLGDEVFALEISTASEPWQVAYRMIGAGDGAFGLEALAVGGAVGLAVSNKDASTVSILVADGRGGMTPSAALSTGENAGPTPVLRWDFNGDGKDDLAVLNSFTDELVVYRGN